MVVVRDPMADYPRGWQVFDVNVATHGPWDFDFMSDAATVNRFAARFRAAKCYREVVFENIASRTADGYSALCGLMLAYSAFDHFLQAIPMSLRRSSTLIAPSNMQAVLTRLRGFANSVDVFKFIEPLVWPHIRAEVTLYLSGGAANAFYLAAAIRHLFAHGSLTPNIPGSASSALPVVSRYLRAVLLKAMDEEFERRVNAFIKVHGGP